jgi:hypothetical protein
VDRGQQSQEGKASTGHHSRRLDGRQRALPVVADPPERLYNRVLAQPDPAANNHAIAMALLLF